MYMANEIQGIGYDLFEEVNSVIIAGHVFEAVSPVENRGSFVVDEAACLENAWMKETQLFLVCSDFSLIFPQTYRPMRKYEKVVVDLESELRRQRQEMKVFYHVVLGVHLRCGRCPLGCCLSGSVPVLDGNRQLAAVRPFEMILGRVTD